MAQTFSNSDPASTRTAKPWYHRNWIIVTALVLLPIIGVPLTWTARWSSWGKVTGSVLGSLWLLLLLSSTTTEAARLHPTDGAPAAAQKAAAPGGELA